MSKAKILRRSLAHRLLTYSMSGLMYTCELGRGELEVAGKTGGGIRGCSSMLLAFTFNARYRKQV